MLRIHLFEQLAPCFICHGMLWSVDVPASSKTFEVVKDKLSLGPANFISDFCHDELMIYYSPTVGKGLINS